MAINQPLRGVLEPLVWESEFFGLKSARLTPDTTATGITTQALDDYALVQACLADRWGNLVYRKTARNFGPIMAMAAKVAIAQVNEIVELGELDPENIVTPGIFVQRVVKEAA